MKRLLLLLINCFLLLTSNAQDRQKNLNFTPGNEIKGRLTNEYTSSFKDSNIVLNNLSLFSHRKPGVYLLPQDNMPCIVPDGAKTVHMPNAWKAPLRVPYRSNQPKIPNLTKPLQNSADGK